MKYVILNPHPTLKQKYRKAGMKESERTFAADKSEQMFFAQCADGIFTGEDLTAAEEKPESPITRTITGVYRVKTPKGDEFIYYDERFEGRDAILKNAKSHSRRVGLFKDVEFTRSIDRKGNMQINRHDVSVNRDPTYEIPLKLDGEVTDPSTGEKIKLASLADFVVDVTGFYVVTTGPAGRKYGLTCTFDDLLNKPFADLVELGKTGKWPISEAKAKTK